MDEASKEESGKMSHTGSHSTKVGEQGYASSLTLEFLTSSLELWPFFLSFGRGFNKLP